VDVFGRHPAHSAAGTVVQAGDFRSNRFFDFEGISMAIKTRNKLIQLG